jgi:hypothetical protein
MFDAPATSRALSASTGKSVPPEGLPQFSCVTLHASSGEPETSPERVMQTRRKTMTTKNEKPAETSSVDYIAWSVEKRNGRTYWTRVGVAFKPHKDGEGFTARFAAGIAVSGEIVFRKPKAEEEQAVTGSDDDIPF